MMTVIPGSEETPNGLPRPRPTSRRRMFIFQKFQICATFSPRPGVSVSKKYFKYNPNIHPRLSYYLRLRGGGERDRDRDRDNDRLSLGARSRSPHDTREGGDSLLGGGGRLSLSSLNRPPSRSRSLSRSRSRSP